jgi:hypothetical protein
VKAKNTYALKHHCRLEDDLIRLCGCGNLLPSEGIYWWPFSWKDLVIKMDAFEGPLILETLQSVASSKILSLRAVVLKLRCKQLVTIGLYTQKCII